MSTWKVIGLSALVAAPLVAVGVVGVMRGWFTFASPASATTAR